MMPHGIQWAAAGDRCWPSREQELLLKAVVLTGAEALEALREWESLGCFDKTDEASFRLLPLLYRNLREQGIGHDRLPLLKGIHRRAWYKNQVLFDAMAPVLESLHKAGFPLMLLKGIPLILLYYQDPGVRPMRDIDVLVPRRDAQRAIEFLTAQGWTLISWAPRRLLEGFFSFKHSLGFVAGPEKELDLHWHVLYQARTEEAERDFWQMVVPLEFQGVPAVALCQTDQFTTTLVHGMGWNPITPIRWIPDAMEILRRPPGVDWERFLDHARRYRLGLPLRDALGYLAERFQAPVPTRVLDSLREIRVTLAEYSDYQTEVDPNLLLKPWDRIRGLYDRHRRSDTSALSFARFLQYHWQLDSPWAMAPNAAVWVKVRLSRLFR